MIYLDTDGHLWAADRQALHDFAAGIGMRREWFQDRPRLYHYDLMAHTKRRAALAAGAVSCTPRELVQHIRAADNAGLSTRRITPVQRVQQLSGALGWAKRDDLFDFAGIRGGKVRTCLQLALQTPGTALVTAGSRHSPQVSIVARVGQRLGRPVRCHVPAGPWTPDLVDAVEHGAVLVQHKAGYNSVIVARARDDAEASGACLIPFGMECRDAVTLTAAQVGNIPTRVGRVVVPVGSGMTLAGILHGRATRGLTWPVVGVVVGGDPTKRLDRWAPGWAWQDDVQLLWARNDYAKPVPNARLGHVPLDPYYEAKCLPFLHAGDLLWVVGHRV